MNENTIIFLMNIAIILFTGFLFIILPRLTRKSFLFGVKIPAEKADSPEASDLRRNFYIRCIICIVFTLGLCVAQFLIWPQFTILAAIYFPLLLIPMFFVVYVPIWRAAVKLKRAQGWAVSSAVFAQTGETAQRGSMAAIPWAWHIAGFIIIVIGTLISIIRYPYLPDYIATHFDIAGNPTTMRATTWGIVMMLPLVNAGMWLVMLLVGISIVKAKLQIDHANPRLSFAQHRVYRRRMGHAMGFLAVTLIGYTAALGVIILFPEINMLPMLWLGLIAIHIPIVVLVVVLIKTGQGGTKVKIPIAELETQPDNIDIKGAMSAERGDDKYWIWGMFYYNPNDPSYIVESRFGTNITFNYARPVVKLGMAVLFVGLAAMYVWATVVLVL